MIKIYTIEKWDNNGYNYDKHTVAIYLDKEIALDYADNYYLSHLDKITVEETEEGVQHFFKIKTIYERQGYDHTEVLFSQVYTFAWNLSKDELINVCVNQASPMVTQEVDFDRLYRLYQQESREYEEVY